MLNLLKKIWFNKECPDMPMEYDMADTDHLLSIAPKIKEYRDQIIKHNNIMKEFDSMKNRGFNETYLVGEYRIEIQNKYACGAFKEDSDIMMDKISQAIREYISKGNDFLNKRIRLLIEGESNV